MKLTIPTKDLRDALSRLAGIPGAFGAALYTQAVKLEAGMAGLTLTRFTSEARISITVDTASVEDEDGTPSVDHGALSTLASRLSDKSVTITTDAKKLHLTSGAAKAAVNLLSDEDETEPPKPELETESIRLPVVQLLECLSIAEPAMSRDNTRKSLQGVCVRMMDKKLCFIGADGKRIQMAILERTLPVDALLSSAGVEAALRALAPESGDCTLAIGESTFSVIGANVDLSMALVAESMPNIETVINPSSSRISKCIISRDKFVAALDTSSIIGDGDSKMVTIHLGLKSLEIVADNKTDSEIRIKLDCKANAAAVLRAPSIQLAQALKLMLPDENGDIEILHHTGTLTVRQSDRIFVIALQRTQETT